MKDERNIKVLESQGDMHEKVANQPIQFRIAEFEFNSESRTTSYSN
jgi:hypothetical protein